jgi:GT2 family glycosyltransferase
MTGPKIYFYDDPKRLWYAGGRIEFWKGWISHIGVREIDSGQYDKPADTQYISGCCVLVKKEVIERIGMLDEAYYIYGEDADWCVRAMRSGYVLRYIPAARIWHKLSVSAGGHLSWFKNWNKLKSQLRVMGRYAQWYQWATIPFWMIVNVLSGFIRVRRTM